MTCRLTFRCDATGDIGFGHLRRCLTLAETATARGHDVGFLLSNASGDTAAEQLQRVAERFERIGGSSCPQAETSALEAAEVSASDVMIADIAHPRVLAERLHLPALLRALHRPARRLAVIEGLGGDAITAEADGIAELIVTPYAYDPALTPRPQTSRQVIGAEFAILDTAYGALAEPRAIAVQGRKILVTTGGSDPTGVAPRILAGCEAVDPAPLEIRVVIGPYFSLALRDEVTRLAQTSRHRVSLVEAPEQLRSEMLWCDMAVSTSGLTKYELAAMGTPAVLLSHDAAHARSNQAFAALGCTLDLGEAEAQNNAVLVEAISGLLADAARRTDMSRCGRAAVDGAGAERIIDAIEELTT